MNIDADDLRTALEDLLRAEARARRLPARLEALGEELEQDEEEEEVSICPP